MAITPRLFLSLRHVVLLVHLCVSSILAYTKLSDHGLRRIPSAGSSFDIQNGELLAPILIPRVPGTPGSLKAQNHFVDFFAKQLPSWTIEWHNSTAKTPATGAQDIPFRNIILRRDPPWASVGDVGRLTMVAHYDSLYRPDGFIGATDSAAPCAMLMHMARSLDEALTQKWDKMKADGTAGDGLEEEKGVQILLLDGEEAWVSWTATDSLYGSRALAESWEATPHPALSTYKSPISSINLFVLLDLLGAANPRVPSYFPTTHWAYQSMADIEGRMRKLGILETKPQNPFLPEGGAVVGDRRRGYVEDDHVPFMARGVDVLHIIPSPFPSVWHTMDDDGPHLDIPTVNDWAKIVTAFVAEWMELEGFMPAAKKVKRDSSEKTEL